MADRTRIARERYELQDMLNVEVQRGYMAAQSYEERRHKVSSIAKATSPSDIPLLLFALSDPDQVVSQKATQALTIRFQLLIVTLPKMTKTSIVSKFALIQEHWRPKVVASLNGQEVKLVKFHGTFPWHIHEHEDEMFFVWRGSMIVEFRDHTVELDAGELCVVSRGMEHRTIASTEAEVIIFEPAATRNTGNIVDEDFTAPNGVSI